MPPTPSGAPSPTPAAGVPAPVWRTAWPAAAGALGALVLVLAGPEPRGLHSAWPWAAAALPLGLGLLGWAQQRRVRAQAGEIASQRRQLSALTRSDEQLRLAERVAQLGSFDWNPVSDELHWSDEHFRLWGHAPGALVPDYTAFRQGVHPDDLPALEAKLQQALQGGGPYDCEHRVRRADGTVRDVHARGDVRFDANGTAVRMIGTVQDITERRRAEAHLHTHQFVLNTITDPVSVVDEQGVYLLVNQAWCDAMVTTPDQVIGQPPGEVQQRLAGSGRDAALRRCIEQRQVQVVLAELSLPGSRARWWEATMFPFTEPRTGRRGASIISRDVTARQAAAQALATSVDHLRLTLNATGDAIFASDATSSHEPLLFVNDRMLQLWNIPPERAASLSPADVMAAARPYFIDVQREFARVAEVVASNTVQEDRITLNDGRVLLRRCIPTEQAGRQVRVWGFRDITLEARTQAALRAAEAQQRALLAAFPGYIACIDAELRYTYVNHRLARLLKSTPGDLVGTRVAEQAGDERAPQLSRQIARALDGEVLSFERHHPAQDGQPERHILLTLARGLDRSTGLYVCYAFGTDITALKHTEAALLGAKDEAERANRAKSAFLSRMSHELRTPMNSVLGFAQLLVTDTDPALTPRQQGQVREILSGGRHLLALINDLLDLARIEADSLRLQLQPVAVDGLLADTVALVAPTAQRRHITLHLPPQPSQAWVTADSTRLRQVLLNLLGNAIKYNRDGGWVRLSCRGEGGRLRLTVADSGPGIDAALQPRLFRQFDRLGAEGGPVEGAGIGLALSQRLLAMMDGEIGLDAAPGEGCRFWVSLPAAQAPSAGALASWPVGLSGGGADDAAGAVAPNAAAPNAADPNAADPNAAARPAPPRVLYIEDNPVNTLLMTALFERLPDLALQCAHDPRAGLAQALADPPALVLVDIQMPGLDGYEVLRRLRAEPSHRDLPVIAVSANAMAQDVARGQAAGFADYLTKPIELQRLEAAVRAALSARFKAR